MTMMKKWFCYYGSTGFRGNIHYKSGKVAGQLQLISCAKEQADLDQKRYLSFNSI